MATVQTHWFTKGGKNLVEQEIGWVASSINVALMKGGWVIDQDAPETYLDVVADEATGIGYTQNGVAIPNRAVVLDPATNETRLIGDAVQWPNSTITARGAIIYMLFAPYALLGYVDFAADRASENGLFRIEWPATGVLRLRAT